MEPTPSKRPRLSPPSLNAPASAPRASFMSPTKSSLSRFNPNILSKADEYLRRSSEGRRSSSPRKLNPTALRTEVGRLSTRLSASPTREPSSSPSRQLRIEGGLDAAPRRPSLGARGGGDLPSARREVEGGEVGRSLVEEEQLAQAVRRSARRTRGNRLSWVRAEEEQEREQQQEPELPPTPEQLGREQRPEKPKGLLSSSPVQRGEKRKKEGSMLGSSPLKPRSVGQVQGGRGEEQALERETQAEEDPELGKRRDLLDKLSAQLRTLQNDVLALEREVRRSQGTGQESQGSNMLPDKLMQVPNCP